ncbi:MAG: hypothetical protein IJY36_00820 [Coprobacter sp.]|nr:hypothetical protein [Coprobacter sp.]
MKKIIFTIAVALMLIPTYAQTSTAKINPELKARSMAEKLLLDDNATARFIPLYQEYMNALMQCRVYTGADTLHTDREIEQYMKAEFESRRKRLAVQERYYDRFRFFLTPRQLLVLFSSPDWDTRPIKCNNEHRRY